VLQTISIIETILTKTSYNLNNRQSNELLREQIFAIESWLRFAIMGDNIYNKLID
jgi:hypothetical protein